MIRDGVSKLLSAPSSVSAVGDLGIRGAFGKLGRSGKEQVYRNADRSDFDKARGKHKETATN